MINETFKKLSNQTNSCKNMFESPIQILGTLVFGDGRRPKAHVLDLS